MPTINKLCALAYTSNSDKQELLLDSGYNSIGEDIYFKPICDYGDNKRIVTPKESLELDVIDFIRTGVHAWIGGL